MIAYHFRAINNDEPSGWVGFAFAENMRDLFWQIDTCIDPYRVEVKKAHKGSVFSLQIKNGDYYDEIESDVVGICAYDDDGWKKPKWVTDPDFEV